MHRAIDSDAKEDKAFAQISAVKNHVFLVKKLHIYI